MTGKGLGLLARAVGGAVLNGDAESVTISDVTHDSRQARSGWLFVAIRGQTRDGHDFVGEAEAHGASAVCVDAKVNTGLPQLVVTETRPALGPLASLVHDHPSGDMKVIGVTGTNGKTTVTHYVESIASQTGATTGLIGTVGTRIAGVATESERTTPEASDFQRLLARMRDAGCEVVATEVSSHALALDRVAATRFEVGAFTNLSQDHLDYHGSMSSYLEAKRRLFTEHQIGTAVVNIDDAAGREIVGSHQGSLITVGREGDVSHEVVAATSRGSRFDLVTPWGKRRVTSGVIGDFNVDNAVLAAACLLAAGFDLDSVASGLEGLGGVAGRFELVSGEDPVRVIVDYAHTPAGISRAVSTARGLGAGNVLVVIGAGGDRDREKRPMMGAAAGAADVVIVTSDNPRREEPSSIAAQVRAGIPNGPKVVVEIDRRLAIRTAIEAAEPGDIVLVLGRGHEPMQEIGDDKVPFDDRVVARAEIGSRSDVS